VATFHQSDLSSWARCPHAFQLGKTDLPRRQTSAMAFGSVVHHSLEVFERLSHTDDVTWDQATEAAVQSFDYYWHPHNIDAICDPVDLWLPKQSYGELRARGMESIRAYAQLMRFDDHELLATEYGFTVPIAGTWDDDLNEPHILAGTVDRLAVRYYKARPAVCIDDFKTGKEYAHLRHNTQFSAYCYASTRPEFWTGWRGEDGFGTARGSQLYQRFQHSGRRGTWINMRTIKFQDAGWRGEKDYERLAIAITQIHASMQADIYPLILTGDTCTYCPYRDVCAGVGVPDSQHGAPTR
jgi:hypothetical protein